MYLLFLVMLFRVCVRVSVFDTYSIQNLDDFQFNSCLTSHTFDFLYILMNSDNFKINLQVSVSYTNLRVLYYVNIRNRLPEHFSDFLIHVSTYPLVNNIKHT